ncbi:MAG: cysteine synthase family protein [Ignavibacteriales bacterium]|nr:cysteine synthase family protein [Ignavibacteriales bacterium]
MIDSSVLPPRTPASLIPHVGNTPLLRIERTIRDLVPPSVEIYGKAEWHNPGGSVKDRPALNMILEGIQSGRLTEGKTIIDATSGNTGIAYAMLGATLGYRVKLALPANASQERKQILRAYGAEIVLTDSLEGTDGAQRIVKEIVESDPERYFYPDQYNNPANWQAHYRTTAVEILAQTQGRITHFVAGLGTTGTFIGATRRLKEHNPKIECIAVQPDSPMHGLEGLKHLPSALTPGIYDASLADRTLEASTDEAFAMARKLAREEGLLLGISSAATLLACIQVAQSIEQGVIVTIFADDGTKYLSERFWNQ